LFFSDLSNTRWLPAKAASIQAGGLDFPETLQNENKLPQSSNDSFHEMKPYFSTVSSSSFVNTLSRSISVDSGYPDKKDTNFQFDSSESTKPSVSLRRYSFQGLEAFKTDQKPTISCEKSFSTPAFLLPMSCSVTKDTKPTFASSFSAGPFPVNYQHASTANVYTDRKLVTTEANKFNLAKSSRCTFPNSAASYPDSQQSLQNNRQISELTSDDLRGRMVSHLAANGNVLKKTMFPQCQCLTGKY